MDIREAIRTTGSVRTFTDEVVADATVYEILDDARFAPSGGNRQGWRVVLVKDPTARTELAAVMRPVWDEYVALTQSGITPFSTSGNPAPYGVGSVPTGPVPNVLLESIESIPVVLVVAADLSRIAMMDKDLDRPTVTGGASVYPFCWSIVLAARARGLGGVMTTFLARAEPLAAPILGLPPDHAIATVIFLGHPTHQPTKLRRDPVEAFATVDRFDGAALAAGDPA